jgi:hypothetical protein
LSLHYVIFLCFIFQVEASDDMLNSDCVLASSEVEDLTKITNMTHEDLIIKTEQREMSDYTSSNNSRSVGIDTHDLDSYTKDRAKATYFSSRSIAVDTSDLEAHYEYYKRECVKRTKTVSTDTRDLDYLKRVTSTSAASVDTNDLQIHIDTNFVNVPCRNGICRMENVLDCVNESTLRGSQQNSNSRNAVCLSPKSNNSHYNHKESRSKSKDGGSNSGMRATLNTEDDSSDDNKFDGVMGTNDNSESSENEDNCEASTKQILSKIKSDESNRKNNVPAKRRVGRPKGSAKYGIKLGDQSPPKRFECEVCKAMFTRKHSLMVHLCIHSGLRPFTCSGCDKAFSTSSQAQRHARMHMQTSSEEAVKEEPGYVNSAFVVCMVRSLYLQK